MALLARGGLGLAGVGQEVLAAGGQALVIPADVSHAAQVERAAMFVEDTWGPITVWVNNAMVSVFSPIAEMTPEEVHRVTDVTYLGTVYGTLAALRRMRPRNQGTIVQVGSALAYRAIPLRAAYCAAKHAVKGFTESLRCELLREKSGVAVVMVHLPAINTPHFDWVRSRLAGRPRPVAPVFQPELAAEAILWAVDHPHREVKLAWPTLKAVWGEKFVAGLADRYLAARGFGAQQGPERIDPSKRQDNLFQPLPMDAGTHGRFDAEARRASLQFWLRRKLAAVATAGLALGLIAAGARLLPAAARTS